MKRLTGDEALVKAREFLREPYSRVLTPEKESGGFSAEVIEFAGCVAEGETPEETYANLEGAAEAWVLACLEQGQDIPAPLFNHEASGRFVLRLSRSTHARATKAAAVDGVSLNTFIASAVQERLGEIAASRKQHEVLRQWLNTRAEALAAKLDAVRQAHVCMRAETGACAVCSILDAEGDGSR